jgi:hypothetical protein
MQWIVRFRRNAARSTAFERPQGARSPSRATRLRTRRSRFWAAPASRRSTMCFQARATRSKWSDSDSQGLEAGAGGGGSPAASARRRAADQ